jgi:class 3 adenylate cyclase/tetratricopeptide (TPR) repeat protein
MWACQFRATRMNVAEWLRDLGLEQYAPAFRDNDIDGEVLRRLTAEDLRELGVASIGHRRWLLDAIAALGAAPAEMASAPSAAGSAAERRQLTVMFCDLVGSTALASRFDPEDLSEIFAAYHGVVTETVAGLAGYVAKYMGDGVLAYFGYPEAHEDDAERAVRAGLAVIPAVKRLELPETLAVRVGIATGLVVVGDLIGEGAAQEHGVVGETPNLASRLQSLAEANSVVIADGTRRQIGALFEVEDLGPQPLAGFAEPQHAWRVVAESSAVNRFEALRSGTTPLVGRGTEIGALLREWWHVKTGEGRLLLISGEPGIGKSRLVAELTQRLEPEPHVRLRYFCSSHHQDSALYPIISQLERAADFARDDTPEEKRAKLNALLSRVEESSDEIELIAELLSLPNSVADLNLTPQRKRQRLLDALVHQLERLAQSRPVLIVFEDAQWSDATSRELLGLIVDGVKRLPIALLITFRPEFQPPWGDRPYSFALTLNRLGESEGAKLVENLAGYRALSVDAINEIVERTDGVPLFLEELTKAVLENADRGDQLASTLAASPTSSPRIPATLHASLLSRLDRLGTAAREIAQVGAVLGREFSYELIHHVARRPDLDTALGRLTDAGLLLRRGSSPQSSYLFKHALVQDAAYSTLLRRRRQQLHGRIAAALEQTFADFVERQPELLAHHLTGAGDSGRAAAQWFKAGQHAAAHSAHVEAIAHLERGLALLPSLPENAERDWLEIELQLALGMSSIRVKSMISPAVRDAYGRASELAEKHGDQRRLFQAVYGVWQHNVGSGRILGARPLAERLLTVTGHDDADPGLRLQAHHAVWTTFFVGGEPAGCHEHCKIGSRQYDPERYQSHRDLYGGHDAGVCAWMFAGHTEWLLGHVDTALASLSRAVDLAEGISHPPSLVFVLSYAALLHVHRGEPELALARLAAAEAVAAQQRLAVFLNPQVLRGATLLMRGEIREGIESLRTGLPPGRTGGVRPLGFALLAEAMAREGDHAQALVAINEALQGVAATGEGAWNPELHRSHGLVLLAQNKLAESEAAFRQAVQLARTQQAKSWELRATTSLARLLGEQGRREEARELLASIYGCFTEGFDTPDLTTAKALLRELS